MLDTFTLYRLFLKNKGAKQSYESAHKMLSMSSDEIESISWQKQKKIFRYAYQHIPFYRNKYSKAGVHIDDIKNPEDFEKLPVLTKEEVRQYSDLMISPNENKDNLLATSTGGSTGEPLMVWQDPILHSELLLWPIHETWGIKYTDPYGVVGRAKTSKLHNKITNLLMYPRQYTSLNVCNVLTESSMMEFANRLNSIRAKYIQGYVGGIYEFSQFCKTNNIKIPTLKAIWTSSAPLPKSTRHFLEDVFECPAYTQYGSCEILSLATECNKKEGMHIFPTARHIEILNSENKSVPLGEIGTVAITNLLDYKFPLIRYINGDRANLLKQKCSCGLNLPLMGYVLGRTTDCIKFPDGTIIAGDYLTTIFDDYPNAVKSFQVCQNKDNSILLKVVKNIDYSNSTQEIEIVCELLRKSISPHLKQPNAFTCQFVDNIPHDRGKQRYVIRL